MRGKNLVEIANKGVKMTNEEFETAFKTAGACFIISCIQDIMEFDSKSCGCGCGSNKNALYDMIAKHYTKKDVHSGECDDKIEAIRALIKANRHKEALERIRDDKEIAQHCPQVCVSAKDILDKDFKNAMCAC